LKVKANKTRNTVATSFAGVTARFDLVMKGEIVNVIHQKGLQTMQIILDTTKGQGVPMVPCSLLAIEPRKDGQT